MAKRSGSFIRRIDETGAVLLAVRLVLGGLFVYMGVEKVGHPIEFLKQIHLYEMLPEDPAVFLNSTAIVLPWLEILCGVALIVGIWVRGAAAMIVTMLAVFTPAILLRALAIRQQEGTTFFQIAFDCGCGSGVVIIWKKLLTNTGLFILALIGVLSRSRRACLAMWFERRKAVPAYCHLCAYAVAEARVGLCEKCATPPEFDAGSMEPAG